MNKDPNQIWKTSTPLNAIRQDSGDGEIVMYDKVNMPFKFSLNPKKLFREILRKLYNKGLLP
jgi:hypothetical protein